MRREARLFQQGYELDAAEEAAAYELAEKGMLTLRERVFVYCVNERDPDFAALPARGCLGRVFVREGADERDGAYRCPECDREVWPGKKERFPSVKVSPARVAIVDWLEKEMRGAGLETREQPDGVLRAPTSTGEVHVCLVDFCADPALFDAAYARRDATLYIIGNPDFAAHVPTGATAFVLADLLLDGAAPLRRTLLDLVGRPTVASPVVLARRAPLSAALSSTPAAPTVPKFALPIGTKWEEVAFDWIAEESIVRLRAPGLPHPIRCTQGDLGWARAHDKWKIMEAICLGQGRVPNWRVLNERRVAVDEEMKRFDSFKRQVARLRDDLQALLGIAGDPIAFCSRKNGLRVRFEANDGLPEKRPWARLKLPPADGDVRVGQPVSDRGVTRGSKGAATRSTRPTA